MMVQLEASWGAQTSHWRTMATFVTPFS